MFSTIYKLYSWFSTRFSTAVWRMMWIPCFAHAAFVENSVELVEKKRDHGVFSPLLKKSRHAITFCSTKKTHFEETSVLH